MRSVLIDQKELTMTFRHKGPAILLGLLFFLPLDARACPGANGAISPQFRGAVVLDFGQQPHPLLLVPKFHAGVDYSARPGDPVPAAGAGTVVLANSDGEYGLTVAIDHGGALETRYGHLSRISVKEGDCVASGTIVGHAGSTGFSPGSQVHFEIRKNGQPLDPATYLSR
jgi:murein DD-endopeptidase MepM/ murein hydrolase activator NlpD